MNHQSHSLSIALMPLENRWDTIQYTAKRADELGYYMFSLPETWSYDVSVLMASLASDTQQIHLASSIFSIWNRSPATLAMATASLQLVSGGRFILGLGASTPQLVEGLHDIPFEAPYKQIRKTLTQVTALLQGDRIPLTYSDTARSLRLNIPVPPPTPILLGAASSKSIKLAGELCDGWMPFLYPLDHIDEGVKLLQEGRQASNNPDHPLQIVPSLPVSVDADATKARETAAWFVAFYITTMGDLYRESLRRMGFGDEVDSVMEVNHDRRPSIVPLEAEKLLEQLTIYGTPQQVREQLNKWYDLGNVTPSLLLAPNLNHEQINYTLKAFQPLGK
jgi:alkanesulfonate monooxygenase SsuD/methylene tetrahydromethanopterin reductase-like flavin-dependent oxidoreductase (luciferase family)